MEKKALQLASVASMIDQFNIPNIRILQSLGYNVDVVADFTNPGTITEERATDLKKRLNGMGVGVIDVAIPRSLNPRAILFAYKQVKKQIDSGGYTLLHCHSPIGGAIARLAAKDARRKNGLKVIYTAHGFHFFNGAPIKNWLVYYPVEKWLSQFTDVLITINKEDNERALRKLHAKKTVYVPGVGVDTRKFASRISRREKVRKELGLDESQIMLFSVVEKEEIQGLEKIICAVSSMSNITLVVAGGNNYRKEFKTVPNENRIDLRFVYPEENLADFYDAADLYVAIDIHEKQDNRLMEAMASGLACILGSTEENIYLADKQGSTFFDFRDIDEIKTAIDSAVKNKGNFGKYNLHKIRSIPLYNDELAINIYGSPYDHLKDVIKRQKKRTEIGVPLSSRLIISVGELSVRKNHKVVVEALQNLPSEYWYIIVGKGDLKDELERIDKSGRLRLLGFRDDVVDLLHASDIFAFPSLQEGLPVALMEAMAIGMPVVCSKIRGNVDLTDNVVNEDSKWKEKILSCDGRTVLPKEFTSENINQRMIEIYNNI